MIKWIKYRNSENHGETAVVTENNKQIKYEIRCNRSERKWYTYRNLELVDRFHALNRLTAKAKVDPVIAAALEANPRVDLRCLPQEPEVIQARIEARKGVRRSNHAIRINKDAACSRCGSLEQTGIAMQITTLQFETFNRSLCGQCENDLLIWFAVKPIREASTNES